MLYDKLTEYSKSGVYPMHMPGHKRNMERLPPGLPYNIDITEVDGFDDLHDPQGLLLETSRLASGLYGSLDAFLLVNGSTVGILSAIGASAKRGDKALIDKSAHRSVFNAVELFGLDPVFITPQTDPTSGITCGIGPINVESALKSNPEIKLVVVTSPTYEGVISDVGAISDIAHKHDIPLIVDGAHGAHLDFSEGFSGGAVRAGADLVVMSLHKTLPALTQCSLLHVNTARPDINEVKRLLSVLQTSSPSYVLMASIDSCLRMLSSDKDRLFKEYEENLDRFSGMMTRLKKLAVVCHGLDKQNGRFYNFDRGKLVIVTKNTAISGFMLADILRTGHKIELELARPGYAVAMTSVCDSPEGFTRLANALLSIDAGL